MRRVEKRNGAFGVGHEAEDSAISGSDARNIFYRAIGVRWQIKVFADIAFRIFERHRLFRLQLFKRALWCKIFAFAMRDWQHKFLNSR